ncbi:MAG: hypothetical protein AAB316_24185 [Bacteroidota bacterium]
MTTITLEKPLTNLQVELLKLFSRNLPEERLLGLKQLISSYLRNDAGDKAELGWDKKMDSNGKGISKNSAPKIEIELKGQTIGILPRQLVEIKQSIEEAYSILDLEADWDDEGSPAIDKHTFIRAIHFVMDYASWLFYKHGIILAPPQILPGSDGSIDILWRSINYRMLINIPSDENKQAEYYGDDIKDGNSIKGKVPTNGIKEHLALWLNNLSV